MGGPLWIVSMIAVVAAPAEHGVTGRPSQVDRISDGVLLVRDDAGAARFEDGAGARVRQGRRLEDGPDAVPLAKRPGVDAEQFGDVRRGDHFLQVPTGVVRRPSVCIHQKDALVREV